MSDAKLVNIARLMTTYNLEIKQLPNNLKCAQCKLVLKDACQGPCCCRFCRVCIDDMITRGSEFCPGDSEECGESLLSSFVSDYGANKRIARLTVKCPNGGCVDQCRLINIEHHLRECQRKSEKCPFRELGCTEDKLVAEEMGRHLQHENRRHSEILIEMIANINREIETLKQRVEDSSREIETLKHINEFSSRQIETLKQREEVSSIEIWTLKQKNEANNREIETLKHELLQKDGQIRSIMEQMIHVQNENKLIKEKKEDLNNRVKILTEEVKQEITERRENDDLDSARVIDHVNRKINSVRRLIRSNKDKLSTVIQSVGDDIESINYGIWLVYSEIQSVQALVGLGQVDASFLWLIDVDVVKSNWWYGNGDSEYFFGEVHPYKYRLASWNRDTGTTAGLGIRLLIYAGPNDEQLAWPFEARVVITVTDMDRREACRSISRQCRIERPPDNGYRGKGDFIFLHSELRGAGLNLIHGVHVLCVIVPGAV